MKAEAAERFGITQPAVSKALSTESSQREELVDIPDTIKGNSSQADFRKLSITGQERVR